LPLFVVPNWALIRGKGKIKIRVKGSGQECPLYLRAIVALERWAVSDGHHIWNKKSALPDGWAKLVRPSRLGQLA